MFFFFSVLLEFSIEEYLELYNKRGIKPFQEINETERLNITQPILTSEGKFDQNDRNGISIQHKSVNRFSTMQWINGNTFFFLVKKGFQIIISIKYY